MAKKQKNPTFALLSVCDTEKDLADQLTSFMRQAPGQCLNVSKSKYFKNYSF